MSPMTDELTLKEKLELLTQYKELKPYLSPAEQREIETELSRMNIAPMRLKDFVREAWHVVEPNTEYQHNWHIDVICDHLEAVTYGFVRNLLINIQPRHMKSLLVSVFWPTWVWSFMPWSKWLCISYAQPLAIRDNLKRRDILLSPWYQRKYGHMVKMAKDQSRKSWFKNLQGGHMIAQGIGGTGLGADFIIGDDILDQKDAYSTKKRSKSNDFWSKTVSTRGNNPKTVAKVLIAQRLHVEDIVGYVRAKASEGGAVYDELIIPTEYEPEARRPPTALGWTDPRVKAGDLLWPDRFTEAHIRGLKADLGPTGTASQLQQRPTPSTGNIFKHSWFKFWKPAGVDLPEVSLKLQDGNYARCPVVDRPSVFDEMGQSWDMNFKGGAGTSYVVGQMWGWKGPDYYLVDQFRDRVSFNEVLELIIEYSKTHPQTIRKYVEGKANGPAVIDALKARVAGLIELNPSGSKESRANAVSPLFLAGNVYLPHPAIHPWVRDYIEELTAFPNHPYDDQVDSTTQILIELQTTQPVPKQITRSSHISKSSLFQKR